MVEVGVFVLDREKVDEAEHHREVEMSDSWEEKGCPRQYSGDIVS